MIVVGEVGVNKNEANLAEPRAVERRMQRIIGFFRNAKRMFTTCIRCTLMHEVNIHFAYQLFKNIVERHLIFI